MKTVIIKRGAMYVFVNQHIYGIYTIYAGPLVIPQGFLIDTETFQVISDRLGCLRTR